MAQRMTRIDHLDLGDAHYCGDDAAVHGAGVYDPIRGVFDTPLRMSLLELPRLAGLDGFPSREQLEHMWVRQAYPGTPAELRHTALWKACTVGGQARVWQVQLLEGCLPVGTPAREAVEIALGEHMLLHIGACMEGS